MNSEIVTPVPEFTRRLSATRCGARLARHVALRQLAAWGAPYGTDLAEAVATVVAELAANAVTHGRVPGRDFEVTARLLGRTLRIEVSDTRGELRPPAPGAPRPALGPLAETGRGLLLVETLADRWEVLDRVPVGKTVVAELNLRR